MGKPGRIFKWKFLLFDLGRITGMFPGWFLFMPKKYNAEGKRYKKNFQKNVVFVCNHNAFQDSFVILSSFLSRRMHMLMARDVMKKLGYFFYSHLGCIPVDRENVDIEAYEKMCEVLNDKRALAIFPEGRLIEDTQSIAPIRSGAILVANRTHSPIIPIYVQPNATAFHRTKVVIGDPIKPYNENNEEVNADDIERWTNEVYDAMCKLKDTYHKIVENEKRG